MSDQSYYDGHISREKLIIFCRAEADALQIENNKVWDVMENPKTTQDVFETMFAKYYVNLGKLTGLRTVAEWAKENKNSHEEILAKQLKDTKDWLLGSQEDFKNQIDGVE